MKQELKPLAEVLICLGYQVIFTTIRLRGPRLSLTLDSEFSIVALTTELNQMSSKLITYLVRKHKDC